MTDPSTLISPMVGAHSLNIATGAPTGLPWCDPIDVDFNGGKCQLDALAEASQGSRHVGSAVPNSPLNKLGYGQILLYELNLVTDIMSSGLTYVIVKPCGLTMAEGGQKELIVGHDDKMTVLPNSIAWADVARLYVWRLFRAQACALTCAPRLVCPHQITQSARRNAVSEPCVTRRPSSGTCPSLISKPCCRFCSVSDVAIDMRGHHLLQLMRCAVAGELCRCRLPE